MSRIRRKTRTILLSGAVLVWCCFVHHAAWGDDLHDDQAVTAFLERLDSPELLVVHLEEKLERTPRNERGELVIRIAELYVQLLQREQDAAQRKVYEAQSRQLLDEAPPEVARQLELSLLQARYREAESIAERYRLRLIDFDETTEAIEFLRDIAPRLYQLSESLRRDIERMQREADRARGRAAAALNEQLRRDRQLQRQSAFLFGWSAYYLAWLDPESASLEQLNQAERVFARLLRTATDHPRPEDVSVDLRSDEATARSILGMALCKSVNPEYTGVATALEWIRLLEHERTESSVREQAPGWKLVIFLEGGAYREARMLLRDRLDDDEQTRIPTAWLRLAAIAALESGQNAEDEESLQQRERTALVDTVVEQFAARGELNQVLELAERFGLDTISGSGFAQRYLRGVLLFRLAQEEQESETVSDQEQRDRYEAIAAELQSALQVVEPEESAELVASVHRLLGWSLYELERWRDAVNHFLEAEKTLPREQAAESLRMAIIALDRLLRTESDAELTLLRDELSERYLDRYPETTFASRLLLHRTGGRESLTEEERAALRDIETDDPSYLRARLRLISDQFRAFRRATADQKASHADQFLDASGELVQFVLAQQEGDLPDEPLLQLARQMLEVALSDQGAAPDVAYLAFELIDRRELTPSDPLVTEELTCRRVQYDLLRGRFNDAVEEAERMWSETPGSVWTRQAVRAVFRDAYRRWERAGSREREQYGRVALSFGGRVLREFEDDAEALARSAPHSVASIVAELSYSFWRVHGEERNGRAAQYLYERLLSFHPRVETYLERAATLAEHFDELESALSHWRRLAVGRETGTAPWYEARFHVISILMQVDPERAAEALQQYDAIYAANAPEPWASRFDELPRETPAARESDS
ncbi:MAG: hypothetical protein EA377_08385 [Phycisphaerales bacterium]|nr:MAG: hypothetical protein EA377_08385 [Phycisphaerales bacterium]